MSNVYRHKRDGALAQTRHQLRSCKVLFAKSRKIPQLAPRGGNRKVAIAE
jgi:hypothetical protein